MHLVRARLSVFIVYHGQQGCGESVLLVMEAANVRAREYVASLYVNWFAVVLYSIAGC